MRTFREAYTAAGAAFAGSLGSSLLDGSVSLPEVLTAAGVALVAGAAVYGWSNRTARRQLR